MATQYTSLLGLALPVTGELSGNWGDVVNDSITSLLDGAVAGTTTLSTDGDVTLTTTTGASNQARQAILLCSGARTALRTITAPAQSKIYTIINATSGGFSVKIVGVGPTTGVTVVAGESAQVAWNGSDFIKVSNTGGAGSFTNVTISGTTTLSGLTASTALALNSSKEVVSVTNTGTGNNVLATSPTLVTPALGTPSAAVLTNATGLPISTGVSGLGTGIATALAVNVGTAGAPVISGGALGTPSSGTVTNLTGTASININGTVGATTANTGAFTTLSASGDVTLSGGTANGVVYANGSKVLTTGSALTFDGSTFQADTSGFRIGKSPSDSPSASIYASVIAAADQTSEFWIGANTVAAVGGSFLGGLGFYNTDNTTPGANLSGIKSYIKDSTGSMYLNFYAGNTYYDANTPQYTIDPAFHVWYSGTTEGMRLTSTGLGIGTSSPTFTSGSGLEIERTDANSTLRLQRAGTSPSSMEIRSGANTGEIFVTSNSPLLFATNGTERLRIDSTGNVGIGTSSPNGRLTVSGSSLGTSWTVFGQRSDNTTLSGMTTWESSSGNAGIRNNAGALTFMTGGTIGTSIGDERLRIDSSGNLGLGVTPSAWNASGAKVLQMGALGAFVLGDASSLNSGSNAAYISGWQYVGTGYATRVEQQSGQHRWFIAPSGTAGNAISFTQAMTLDASGRLLVGGTSAQVGAANGAIDVMNTSGDLLGLSRFTNASGGSAMYFQKSRGAAVGTNTIVQSGDSIGAIYFRGANGTGYSEAAYILAAVDGTPGASADMPGRLVFATSSDGSATPTERARIDSSGTFMVGTTSTSSITQGFYVSTGAGTLWDMGHASGVASGAFYGLFRYAGTVIGSITQSGTTAVLYNVTSDQRLKENIIDAPEFGSVIDAIQVRSYDWRSDGSHQRAGFVAQELVTVAPEAVHQPEDPEDMMAVDYSKLVPMLVKEIQSLRARVAQLESN